MRSFQYSDAVLEVPSESDSGAETAIARLS
jgi:hypothetical protein